MAQILGVRDLNPYVEDYDSDESSTARFPEPVVENYDSDQSEAYKRSSNKNRATWDSAKTSGTDKAESSSGTTLITGPVIETKPRGVVKKVEPQLKTHLTPERRPTPGRARRSSTTTRIHRSSNESDGSGDQVSGSISPSELNSEEDSENLNIIEDEIEPVDGACRPNVARPRRQDAQVVKNDTSSTRRRSSLSRAARNKRKPYPQRSQFNPPVQGYPGYPNLARQPWPQYPPNATPPMTNPSGSPPSGGYAPPTMIWLPSSGYAPSTMPGATLVPWGYWPPAFNRPPTPPPRWPTPTPTPPTPPPPPPPRSPPPPPPDSSPLPEPGRSTDPIELIETYLEALKESKQKQLLDASRILTLVNQKLGVHKDTPTLDLNAFRLPDEATEASEIGTASGVRSEVVPSVLSHSTVRSRNLNSEPERRAPEERMISGHLANPNANFSMSLHSDNTVRPYHLRNGSSTEGRSNIENRNGTENEITQSYYNSWSKVVDQIQLLRQDVISLQSRVRHLESRLSRFRIGSVWARWKKAFRKNPPPGTQRLEWTCECGEELFDDYPITNVTRYQQMLAYLQNSAPTARLAYQTPSDPPDLEAGNVGSNLHSLSPTPNSFIENAAPGAHLSGSGTTYIESGSPQGQSLEKQSGDKFTRTKYLELCVNVGAYETKLTEIKVISSSVTGTTICTDGHLFRQIHDAYFSLRKDTWRRLLYRPAGIKFVHFGVEYDRRVDLYDDEPFPPEDMVVTKQYEYNPPPIDSRTFLHHFWKYKKHSKSTSARYVGRLPKKLGESLLSYLREAEQREGWGIHIIEGPNKPVICCALLIVLLMSFITAAVYDAVVKNGDSGFAIGQWMVAALAVALSALYFSLEDDVITTAY